MGREHEPPARYNPWTGRDTTSPTKVDLSPGATHSEPPSQELLDSVQEAHIRIAKQHADEAKERSSREPAKE